MNESKTKQDKPKLPEQLPAWTAEGLLQRLLEEQFADRGTVGHERLEARIAGKVTIDTFRLQHVDATAFRADQTEWVDVIFEHCDLSNLDLSGAVMHRVEFRDCKLMGLDLSEATLRHVSFEQCDLRYLNLRYGDLKRVAFDQCTLTNGDCYQASFQEVSLSRSNLDQIQLTGVKLAGLDLSTCEFSAIDAEPGDLRGCRIAPAQAIAFAPLLGLIVDV